MPTKNLQTKRTLVLKKIDCPINIIENFYRPDKLNLSFNLMAYIDIQNNICPQCRQPMKNSEKSRRVCHTDGCKRYRYGSQTKRNKERVKNHDK